MFYFGSELSDRRENITKLTLCWMWKLKHIKQKCLNALERYLTSHPTNPVSSLHFCDSSRRGHSTLLCIISSPVRRKCSTACDNSCIMSSVRAGRRLMKDETDSRYGKCRIQRFPSHRGRKPECQTLPQWFWPFCFLSFFLPPICLVWIPKLCRNTGSLF